jgi:hypothetical protein
MTTMNDETLDRDVREAIEPDAGAVDRLVREALRQDRPQRSVRGPLVATAGAVLLLVGAVLVLNREDPQTVPPQMRVMNVGETIVVKPTSGGVWLIGADGANADQLPAGTIIVYRSGEGR